LCTRIGDLKWHGLLGDWGYAIPGAECITTTIANSEIDQPPDGAHAPTLPVETPAEFNHSVESSNCVPVMPVDSTNASTSLTLVSDLTKEDKERVGVTLFAVLQYRCLLPPVHMV